MLNPPRQFMTILLAWGLRRCTGCNRIFSNSILHAADHAPVHVTDYRCKFNKVMENAEIGPIFSYQVGTASNELTILTICCRTRSRKIPYLYYITKPRLTLKFYSKFYYFDSCSEQCHIACFFFTVDE